MAEQELLEHADFLRRLVRGLVLDADRVDDVVQETYLRALARPPRHARNLRAWLATIARHIAFRLQRESMRRTNRERRAGRPDRQPPACDAAARAEVHRRLAEAVARLDEPYRSAIVGRYLDGRTPAEMAAELDVSVKTVKSRLHRGLALLRARLDRAYGDRATWSLLLLPLGLPQPGGAVAAGVTFLTMKKIIAALAVLSLTVVWIGTADRRRPADSAAPRARHDRAVDDVAPARGDEPPAPAGDAAEPAGAPDAHVFAGRVVDGAGTGVADASVRLLYWGPGTSDPFPHGGDRRLRRSRERREAPGTRTDAEGRFRFDRPWASRSYLHVDSDGFAPVVSGPHEPRTGLEVVVDRREPFEVVVVDPDGVPVAGALVRIVPDTRAAPYSSRTAVARSRTDAAGAVALPCVEARHLLLEVAPREAVLGFVSLPLDAVAKRRITVPRIETRTHRIVDAVTGEPLPAAFAIVAWSGYRTRSSHQELERRRVQADEDGVLRFPLQPDYDGHLVTAPGYEAQSLDRPVVPLRRSVRVEGVVVDADGNGVAGAAILIATVQGAGSRCFAHLPLVADWSDAQGRFAAEIKLLQEPPGADGPGIRTMVAVHPKLGCAVRDSVPARAGTRPHITLRMPRPAELTIEVVGADGRPRIDYWMSLRRRVPAAHELQNPALAFGLNVPWLLGQRMVTDADGRVSVDRLPPGAYDLDVKEHRRELALRDGERRTLRVVLGTGPAIAGRVLDEHGRPRAGVGVGLGGPRSAITQTDAEGRFRFEDVEEGTYTVGFYSRRANAQIRVTTRPGETDVELREPTELARLRIEVIGPPRGTAEYWYATARGSQYPQHGGGYRGIAGDVALSPSFEPSKGVLVVRAKGHAWRAVPFEAAAGGPTHVSVDLPRAGGVDGTVEGSLLAGDGPFHVYIQRADGSPGTLVEGDPKLARVVALKLGDTRPSAQVEGGGGFRIEDVAPGRYRAILYRRDGRVWIPVTQPRMIDVVAASPTTLSVAR